MPRERGNRSGLSRWAPQPTEKRGLDHVVRSLDSWPSLRIELAHFFGVKRDMVVKLESRWFRGRCGLVTSRGFTLLEMLVVIAVLALLLAILVPSVTRAISTAKAIQCRANLGTQAQAYFSLISDRDGMLLEYNEGGRGPAMTYLQGYVEQASSLFCPLAPKVEGRNGWGGREYAWQYRGTYSSYTFNGWLHLRGTLDGGLGADIRNWSGSGVTFERHWGNTIDSVDVPSEVPLYSDGYWIDTWPQVNQPVPTSGLESENRTGNHGKFLHRAVTDRHHDDWQNVSFVDGHTEQVAIADMGKLIWSPEYLDLNP